MMPAHGFGCDQNMWRLLTPSFEGRFRTLLFEHVGSGESNLSAYDRVKCASLQGYANDIDELLDAHGSDGLRTRSARRAFGPADVLGPPRGGGLACRCCCRSSD